MAGEEGNGQSSSIARRQFLQATACVGLCSGTGVMSVGRVAAAGGDEQWRFSTGNRVESSPTVVNATVFVGSNDANVYALDAETGEEEWRFETGDWVSSSPTVVDSTVYVGSGDANVYALDTETGEEEWRFETGAWIWSSPTVVDGTVFVGSHDANVYALDSETGEEEWRFETGDWVTSSPTVVDGTLYVGSNDANLYALGAETGEEEWRFETGDLLTSSPTVADGTVFVGSRDANVYALDAKTGEEEWRFETGATGSSPTVVDGIVYIGSRDTNVYALDVETGEEEWRFETGSRVGSSPTVADGTVFVGSVDANVYALDARTGAQRWRFETGATDSSPTVVDGTLYVGSFDANVYALDADVSGSSEGSRVRLGTLGHHENRADRASIFEPEGPSQEEDSSQEETPDEDSSQEETPDEDPSLVGTPAMLALGGGGGLLTLLGAYVLLRRSDDPDQPAERKPTVRESKQDGKSHFPSDLDSAAQRASADSSTRPDAPSSVSPTQPEPASTVDETDDELDKTDDKLDEATMTLDTAREAFEASNYYRAFFHCVQAIETVEDARDERAGDSTRVTDVDARLDEAVQLREDIEAELDAFQQATRTLDRTAEELDDAETALEDDKPRTALNSLDGIAATLEDTTDTIEAHDFSALADQRDSLARRHERLRERAEEVLRAAPPTTIPSAPRISLSYDDIQKGKPLGQGGNADVYYATLTTDDALELALKEPRMGDVSHADTVEKLLAEVRTWQEDDNYLVAVVDTSHRETVEQVLDDAETWRRLDNPDTLVAVVATHHTDTVEQLQETAEMVRPHDATDTVESVVDTVQSRSVDPLLEEAEMWQKLDDHDHIVSVVDYGHDPAPWIAMEYMDGGHLGKRAGEMALDQALWTALATTEGVRHAHDRGVAHFDLKPQNVLLRRVEDAWDVPKVADWGLSTQLLDHSSSVAGMSFGYAAPEQFDTDTYGRTDNVTDIYQLGAVFYELFTGWPPFEGSMFEVAQRIQTTAPTPPSERADLPTELDDILLTALATDKDDRYEHVLYLRDELQTLYEEYSSSP